MLEYGHREEGTFSDFFFETVGKLCMERFQIALCKGGRQ